jgi:hypothetical protein
MTRTRRKREQLSCPTCGMGHTLSERFCTACGMPLIATGPDGEAPVSDQQARARKIEPIYTQGELVKVAGGRNQAEAELIQGLLLEEGVPSMLRRTRGFDVPDFLAAGPRDVLVPASGADAARDLLRSTGMEMRESPAAVLETARVARVAALVLVAGSLAALIAWGLLQLSA